MMSTFYDEYNKGKAVAMAAIDEFYAADVVFHSGAGRDIRGLKDYKQYRGEFLDAFPDAHATIDDVIVEGNKKATRLKVTGTHKGEFMGITATNRKVTIPMISFSLRNAIGKVVEEWQMYDSLDFMQQLGVIPRPKGR
jgi:steroid delta-isomerase-like uncharacterized protein